MGNPSGTAIYPLMYLLIIPLTPDAHPPHISMVLERDLE